MTTIFVIEASARPRRALRGGRGCQRERVERGGGGGVLDDGVGVQAQGVEHRAVVLAQLVEAFAREEQRARLGRVATEETLQGS